MSSSRSLLLIFETRSHSLSLDSLELSMQTKLAVSTQRTTCDASASERHYYRHALLNRTLGVFLWAFDYILNCGSSFTTNSPISLTLLLTTLPCPSILLSTLILHFVLHSFTLYTSAVLSPPPGPTNTD